MANYGGRVTDDQDRRCIYTHMADFYNKSVLEDDHEFCKNGKALNYYNPEERDMDEYVKFIKE